MNEVRKLQGEYAGFVSRAIAFGIDLVVVTGIIAALSWIIVKPLEFFGIDVTACTIQPLTVTDAFQDAWCYVYIIVMPIVVALTIVSYFVFLWTLTGWTVGKGLMGIRVVSMDGKPLKIRRGLLRYFGYFVSAIPLGAGFFWVLISDSRQGWHDKLGRTYVLYSWEARENERILHGLERYAERFDPDRAQDRQEATGETEAASREVAVVETLPAAVEGVADEGTPSISAPPDGVA